MLIEFRVENHRSLLTEQVLSMRSGRADQGDDVNGPVLPRDLLRVAAIYGANASGKSNVLAALEFMGHAVLDSHLRWSPDEGVPRDPFAWGAERTNPSFFEVSILVGGSRFDYGYTCDDGRFLEEWLFGRTDGEKQPLFERDLQSFQFAEALSGNNKSIEEMTRPNALFLSVASQFNHPELSKIYSWFAALRPIHVSSPKRPVRGASLRLATMYGGDLPALLDESDDIPNHDGTQRPSFQDRFLALLKDADTGIVGIKRNPLGIESYSHSSGWSEYLLNHQHDSGAAWLPLLQESRGTQTLFRIGLPVLNALERGGVLLIDEFESSLHPQLARAIVRQFNDPGINRRNAQLIFTTHDTNLLGNVVGDPVLTREQIWLTEKDNNGTTTLYPLTDYKQSDHENLRRDYLQGRFGAIPFLGKFSLADE